jgi:hypothetical protein
MKLKVLVTLSSILLIGLTTTAQVQENTSSEQQTEIKLNNTHHKFLDRLDLAVSAGTTGIGVDISTPINDYLQVRAGFTYMPKFDYNMDFDVQVGDVKEDKYDSDGNRVETKFDKLASMMKELTGLTVDDNVTMIGEPTFYNAKLLLDVYPFRNNKHWYVTAGFYYGKSTIAKAVNSMSDMSSLLAVCIYNEMYEKALNDEPVLSINGIDIYRPSLVDYGKMGVHVGDYVTPNADGSYSPYMMVPDDDSTVSAKIKVNRFKPYLGIGYKSYFGKNNRWSYGIDGGVLFWGGTPKIITHEGVDLAKDVKDISGKVGDYVDFFKTFKVFPVLNFRIAYNIL